ncbi:hypothetical protein WA171_000432 [Blastocystis sp. BT1]
MSDIKRVKVDNVESTTKKMNGVEWRMKWKEYLKESVLNDNKNCMLNLNVDKGEMRGVCKRGEEVIEVKENENEVELMIVNVLNHSMIVLKGLKGEELNEMDLSELVENEIVDLNDDGMRWEGEVLKGDLFGYGCLYDEENELEYEGWMIEGKKRCYGIEYWNDIGLKKYCGCYYDGLKNGYGLLYDRNGMIEYEGLFKDDVIIDDDDDVVVIDVNNDLRMKWIDDCELIVTSCVESLIIDDHFNPDISSLILNYSLISLKRIEIGNDCFVKVSQFDIDGLNELETVDIGSDSFCLHEKHRYESKCLIMNCDQLSDINIGDRSFRWYESFELKNLPSLMSIQLDYGVFCNCHSIVFDNLNQLLSITFGEWTLCGDEDTVISNELIMKNLPSLSLIEGYGYNFFNVGKVILDNIPLLTQNRIYMRWNSVQRLGKDYNVRELYSSNADSFDRFIRQRSKYLLKINEEYNNTTKRFEYKHSHDLSVFDTDCLKGIERLEIEGDCFMKVNRFVIDELSILKSMIIGQESFKLCESFELKNLPSLISIQLDDEAFCDCQRIVFENLTQLQSITLGIYTLYGDSATAESNELKMKNLPSLSLFKGEGSNFRWIDKVILDDIMLLTEEGIQLRKEYIIPFNNVKKLSSSNADSLDQFIRQNSKNL